MEMKLSCHFTDGLFYISLYSGSLSTRRNPSVFLISYQAFTAAKKKKPLYALQHPMWCIISWTKMLSFLLRSGGKKANCLENYATTKCNRNCRFIRSRPSHQGLHLNAFYGKIQV